MCFCMVLSCVYIIFMFDDETYLRLDTKPALCSAARGSPLAAYGTAPLARVEGEGAPCVTIRRYILVLLTAVAMFIATSRHAWTYIYSYIH